MGWFRRDKPSATVEVAEPVEATEERGWEAFARESAEIPAPGMVSVGRTNVARFLNDETALAHSAIWSCVFLRSGLMASFPAHAYRETEEGRTRLPTQPGLLKMPTAGSTGQRHHMHEFAAIGETSLCLRGNFYCYLVRDYLQRVVSAIPLNPDAVVCRRNPETGLVEYRIGGQLVDPVDIWHQRRFVLPGQVVGLSAISAARVAISMGLSAEEFGARFFTDGGHPTGLLKSKDKLTPEQAQVAKERWRDAIGRSREAAVLGGEWEYTAIQVSPEDSQFIEAIGANAAMVARYFMVPPELIGAAPANTGTLTYDNRESRSLDFLAYYIQPCITAWETGLGELLPRGQYVKLNVDSLLRSDALTQVKVNRLRLLNGETIPDELRALADKGPLPDGQGQIYLWPPQNVVDANASSPDPPAVSSTDPAA